jgi:hypothetical protein
VTGDELKNSPRAYHSSLITHHSRSGIALVITLIMLSVTLVMAIAFIAASQRAKNASTTGVDSTTARLAADSALAAAQAQIVANIFVTNAAAFDFKLLVSTNFQNPHGYVPLIQNPTNVNYDYRYGGGALNADDFNQNVANLFFLPRVPVSIYNRATGSNDFRFYLDLNRNGLFETNGWVAEQDNNANTNGTFIYETGDPEWVGILERPDQPHSGLNRFVARYAFFAQPIGNSLDLNGVHNQAVTRAVNPAAGINDGYLRNQGVGTWELNLAGFLADLNTNVWGQLVGSGPDAPAGSATFYQYNEPFGYNINRGVAFDDARALLSYRYSFAYNHLASANFALAPVAANILPYDNIDTYSDGPVQFTSTNANETVQRDNPTFPWVGANNPTNFYALPAELFDPNKVGPSFVSRLSAAGTNTYGGTTVPTYDRYTFYRLLSQLGTDSAVDDMRMNLNYNNLARAINGVANVNGTASATNLLPWSPLAFFTNAADRMLTLYTTEWLKENTNAFYNFTNTFGSTITNAFGVTRIPVYVNGRFVYTPAVNRILQLAANLYDATTNDVFPSVFRPIFTRAGTNVFITDYVYIGSVVGGPLNPVFSSPTNIEAFAQGSLANPVNLYGVPWIIGAKKGLPNFNRFYSLNNVQVTRKLEVTRNNPSTGPLATNVMYVMSITNHLGWSLWNSYDANYLGTIDVVVRDNLHMQLSNDVPRTWSISTNFITPAGFSINNWPGSAWTSSGATWEGKEPVAASFVYSNWNCAFIPESIYRSGTATFDPLVENPAWEVGVAPPPPLPKFDLRTTNYLQAYLIDRANGRIVDYVQFAGPASYRQLNEELRDPNYPTTTTAKPMWSTNRTGVVGGPNLGPTWGMAQQLLVSQDFLNAPSTLQPGWVAPPNLPPALKNLPKYEAAFFNSFYSGSNFYGPPGVYYFNDSTNQQAPYTPSRLIYEYTMWSANDPLVHYLASDLQESHGANIYGKNDGATASPMPQPDKVLYALDHADAVVESRYQPWGRNQQLAKQGAQFDNENLYNFAYRDPLVWGSDFWEFPTNNFPSVGWIGRVHRGTPWQTVFLKATNILDYQVGVPDEYYPAGRNTWGVWTGNQNIYDNRHAAPVEDRLLFDLFTTAPNANAQRGALSPNQTELASLSALLSGLVVLTNDLEYPVLGSTPTVTNLVISPAGPDVTNSPVWQIQQSLLATRANTNIFPQAVFTHVGDILRVPALSEQSPFLNRRDDNQLNFNISDELYEWLPQQTLGLLRLGTPRFVVYCYGQALRPAPNGTVFAAPFAQLVTNYQVVAESAQRVVLRVDNPAGTNGSPRVVIESSRPLAPE